MTDHAEQNVDSPTEALKGSIQAKPPQDLDLTNLSWVSGAPVPIQGPVSPASRVDEASQGKTIAREDMKTSSVSAAGVGLKRSGSCSPERVASSHRIAETGQKIPFKKRTRPKGKRPRTEKENTKFVREEGSIEGSREDKGEPKKPACSYTSLIGLALLASERKSLFVSEIYSFVE